MDPLSLREKIGQMLIVGFDGATFNPHSALAQAIDQCNLGGVILFDIDLTTNTTSKNIVNKAQLQTLNAALQQFTEHTNLKRNRPQLPLIISVDYEGGQVNRLKEHYGFPQTYAAADIVKLELVQAKKAISQMARTLKETGFNVNFAPVLDLNINQNNPVLSKKLRCYSNEPSKVAKYGNLVCQTMAQQGIACAVKHFPGHGSSTKDSHLDFVDVSDTWQPAELEPYAILLAQTNAPRMVMTAHVVNRQLDPSGLPATLSNGMLNGLLRQQMNFDGVIITDDMQMRAIRAHYGLEKALVLAINAGIDMFIFGNQLQQPADEPSHIITLIENNVHAGNIEPLRIEEAYRRIAAFKQTLHYQCKNTL